MKNEKIIILAKSGGGKNYLVDYLTNKGMIPEVKTTTRPIREGEISGHTYNYTTTEVFLESISKGLFNEYETFNTTSGVWYYGSTKEDFDKSQIFIKTVGGLNQLSKEERSKCFVVYLDIDRDILQERLINRNDPNDSIKRRLDSDDRDFEGFTDYDLRITDPEYDPEIVWELAN